MPQLVVAEKPSVAQSIAGVIGANQRRDGYMEGNGYLVSWCIGHLVELAQPNAYGDYEKWRKEDLPILPDRWQYEVTPSTKKQFQVLRDLMKRTDVERLICATYAGREPSWQKKRACTHSTGSSESRCRSIKRRSTIQKCFLICRKERQTHRSGSRKKRIQQIGTTVNSVASFESGRRIGVLRCASCASVFICWVQAFCKNAQPFPHRGNDLWGLGNSPQQAESVWVLPRHCLPLVSPCVPHAFGVSFRNAFV